MKKGGLFLFVLTVFLIATIGSALAFDSPLKVGWVIGSDANNAVILHTKNGGKKWVVQGKWAGYDGMTDISAVDKQTAWAALGSPKDQGIILHTTNGGTTWSEQKVLDGVEQIKNIKGLTRHEAWAVSLTGTILHTTDGGKNWNIVEHPGIEIGQVNRMDAIGYRDVRTAGHSGKNTSPIHSNVWIADELGEDEGHLGMIHTLYNGDIWRQEFIPCTNPPPNCRVHMVSAYSPRVVWAAAWGDGTLYRTTDGGETWNDIDTDVIGGNDLDDMCAYSADALWLVQYVSYNSGFIYHVRVFDAGEPVTRVFDPPSGYAYGGLTCVDDQTALALGYTFDPSTSPKGVIVSTTDGGDTWVSHPLPVDDFRPWKVSFVGARR